MKSTLKGAKSSVQSFYLFGQQLVLEICLLCCQMFQFLNKLVANLVRLPFDNAGMIGYGEFYLSYFALDTCLLHLVPVLMGRVNQNGKVARRKTKPMS